MPKGLKRRANKNKTHKIAGVVAKRELPIADDYQGYARVIRSNGDRRFDLECQDGETRLGVLRGNIRKRKKSWLNPGSWIIYSERQGFTVREKGDILRRKELEKVDIIVILDDDEKRRLVALEEIVTEEVVKARADEEEEAGFTFVMNEDFDEI